MGAFEDVDRLIDQIRLTLDATEMPDSQRLRVAALGVAVEGQPPRPNDHPYVRIERVVA